MNGSQKKGLWVIGSAVFAIVLLLAALAGDGRVEVWRASDDEARAAAEQLCALEGILPALESSHALAMLPRLAREGVRTVVLGLSGRGDKDLATYTAGMTKGGAA